jgi:hypothetical protein
MKVSELRIGNWVLGASREKPQQITAFMFLHFEKLNLKPIPITPEILTKNIGFNIKQTKWRTLYKYGKLSLDKTLYGETSFSFCFGHHGIIEIDNVHQLQNLYFELSGEELNIDL